ncbi:MAG: hypothetical protein ACOYJ8_03730 [Patescibacteria group bacterium]|jgi:hypothetical protein
MTNLKKIRGNKTVRLIFFGCFIFLFLFFPPSVWAEEIDPSVIIQATIGRSGDVSGERTNIETIKTPDGTIHVFVNLSGHTQTCNGVSATGLVWLTSNDDGDTWNCQQEIYSGEFYPEAVFDDSNNIYLVYSDWEYLYPELSNGTIFYRKLYKDGSSWVAGNQQTVVSPYGDTKYFNASIALEGGNRLWIAARSYDGTDSRLTSFYSDSQLENANWLVSNQEISLWLNERWEASTPQIIEYGSNTAIIYVDESLYNSGHNLVWRTRNVEDNLNEWNEEEIIIPDTALGVDSVISDDEGNVYLLAIEYRGGEVSFLSYNGIDWTLPMRLTDDGGPFAALSFDGSNILAFYSTYEGLRYGLLDAGKFYYRKISPPYTMGEEISFVERYKPFDKVFTFISDTYEDVTEAAGNENTSDFVLSRNAGNILYIGGDQPFDSVVWNQSTSTNSGDLVWEYYNGSGWEQLEFIDSEKANFSGGSPSNRWFNFTPPDDWGRVTVNNDLSYYLRARIISEFTIDITLSQILPIPSFGTISGLISSSGDSNLGVVFTDVDNEFSSSPFRLGRVRFESPDSSSYSSSNEPDWDPYFSISFDDSQEIPDELSTGGDADWFIDDTVFMDGIQSASSGTITDDQSTYLKLTKTITQESILKFYWFVSSEEGYDGLSFCINNDDCVFDDDDDDRISGSLGLSVSKTLAPGDYSFVWKYSKDGSADEGLDRGWVDGITLTSTVEPEITPTPTPVTTPTPTPISDQDPISQEIRPGLISSVSEEKTKNSAPVCGESRPLYVPDLFQINVTDNTASLFFTPIPETDKFFISFSEDPLAESHGEIVSLSRNGVQNHLVYLLKPETTYYFKVRGQKGCAPGDWSNVMAINTNREGFTSETIYYKNSPLEKIVSLLSFSKEKVFSEENEKEGQIDTPDPTATYIFDEKKIEKPAEPSPVQEESKFEIFDQGNQSSPKGGLFRRVISAFKSLFDKVNNFLS